MASRKHKLLFLVCLSCIALVVHGLWSDHVREKQQAHEARVEEAWSHWREENATAARQIAGEVVRSDHVESMVRHDAYTLLGVVELEKGDKEDAERALFLAGKAVEEGERGTLRPSVLLASRILTAGGSREAVYDYLKAIGPTWPDGDEPGRWRRTLLRGEQPDFGAHARPPRRQPLAQLVR